MTGPEPRTPLETARAAERQRVLRHLLVRPLLLARQEPELFAAAVRHRAELASWFAEQPGWRLNVDAAAGHVRLFKRAARPGTTRAARPAGREPFDRRRYTLLCLTLAALEAGAGQTTLATLVRAVRDLSVEEAELRPFDPGHQHERRAFVDVIRLLEELGVLTERDGDAEGYARRGEGDALYDVADRLLGQLLASPRPPALAGSPARMAEEARPQTEEGERVAARHALFRALLDDPVLYLEDLDDRARAWLEHGRGHLYDRLEEDVGLVVERRAEGLAAVDPAGVVTDSRFPEGNSTVKHAALLLCEWLADRARACGAGSGATGPSTGACVTPAALEERVAALREAHGSRWAREYAGDADGVALLAREAMAVLLGFGLAARTEAGWVARPAAARFAPASPNP